MVFVVCRSTFINYTLPVQQEKLMQKEKQSKNFLGFFTKKEKKEDEPEVAEKVGFGIPFQVRFRLVTWLLNLYTDVPLLSSSSCSICADPRAHGPSTSSSQLHLLRPSGRPRCLFFLQSGSTSKGWTAFAIQVVFGQLERVTPYQETRPRRKDDVTRKWTAAVTQCEEGKWLSVIEWIISCQVISASRSFVLILCSYWISALVFSNLSPTHPMTYQTLQFTMFFSPGISWLWSRGRQCLWYAPNSVQSEISPIPRKLPSGVFWDL